MTTVIEKINDANNMLSGIDRINPYTGEYINDNFLTDEKKCIIDIAFSLYTEAFDSYMETYGEHHYRTQYLITEIGKMFISPKYSQYNDSDEYTSQEDTEMNPSDEEFDINQLNQRTNDWLNRNGAPTDEPLDEEFDIDQLNQRANDWLNRNGALTDEPLNEEFDE